MDDILQLLCTIPVLIYLLNNIYEIHDFYKYFYTGGIWRHQEIDWDVVTGVIVISYNYDTLTYTD